MSSSPSQSLPSAEYTAASLRPFVEKHEPEKVEGIERMEKALDDIRRGELVMVMDSDDREDECDLIGAAENLTPAKMAFMIRHSTGIVCVASNKAKLESLGLHPATGNNTDVNQTNFYVATDYIPTTTTGVSWADRVETVKAMCKPVGDGSNGTVRWEDFSKPGHMFPLCAREAGVLVRPGHTESTYDLVKLAGMKAPVGVLAELMHSDSGEMFRLGDSKIFAQEHGLTLVHVSDIIDYRNFQEQRKKEEKAAAIAAAKLNAPKLDAWSKSSLVDVAEPYCIPVETAMPLRLISNGRSERETFWGMKEKGCRVLVTGEPGRETIIVIKGEVEGRENVPVRIHSECFTGDTLGSLLCDCGEQLRNYMLLLDREEYGVLVYCKGHEGRGIGLYHKMRAYNEQRVNGLDTIDANTALGFEVDTRTYKRAIEALQGVGVSSVQLYSNNPEKRKALEKAGITISMTAFPSTITEYNARYLETKAERSGHKTLLQDFEKNHATRNSANRISQVCNTNPIVIIGTAWNTDYVKPMASNAIKYLTESCGLSESLGGIKQMTVPGHMELITGARIALQKYQPSVVICLGVMIKGESDLYEAHCAAVSNGLSHLAATQDVPIIQGILMCRDEEQAKVRTVGDKNPGAAHAMAWVDMVYLGAAEETKLP